MLPTVVKDRQQPRAPGSRKPGSDRARMGIHFELILNSLTPRQPQRRGRGRTSPTQRCGARDLRPGAVLCPAVRRGALQTARRAAPASTSGRPGAAAPWCGPLAPAPAAATPGPGVQSSLRARKQDRGPRGLSGHRPGGRARTEVSSAYGCPRAPPCAHLHLHLGTERLRGPGLPGWIWLSWHRAPPGIWGT